MAEHEGPTNDSADGDELAARLRTALDSRVEPVRLDEIELRARTSEAASRNGSTVLQAVAPVDGGPAAPDVGDVTEVADPEPVAAQVSPLRRRRWPQLLAAAAMVAVLVGVAAVVLRDPAQDLETVAPAPEPEAPAFAEPAPGGIYDLAGGLLRTRTVISMASAGGRVYLGYAPKSDTAIGDERGGVLVADASDGRLLADHKLDRAGPASMTGVADGVWFVNSGGWGATLWRLRGDDVPEPIDDLTGPMELASDGTTVWLRGGGTLQWRDAVMGDLVVTSEGEEWAGLSRLAAADGAAWALDGRTDEVVRLERDGSRVAVRKLYGGPVQILGSAGGSLFVKMGGLVERHDGADESLQRGEPLYALLGNTTGADSDGDKVWMVGEGGSPDPYSAVEVLVVDGATGESMYWKQPIVGWRPHVAVIDERGAVLCVGIVPADGDGAVGSDCRQIPSPFMADGTVPEGWTTSDPATGNTVTTFEASTDTTELASAPTSTTAPSVTTTTRFGEVTTTTAPPSRPLDPRGISVAGLAPIRLGMTADELTAATGLATVATQRRCGQNGRAVLGMPDGVYVTFNGDDTVRAVTIRTAAFATADGLSVDSTVADLLAVHPDAEVVDQITTVQHIVAAPDRSSAIFVNAVDDDIEVITVAQGTGSFMDLC